MATYTQEQLNQIYDKLPEELQEAIFSMETANAVYNACLSYGAGDERGNKVSELVGQVLMGLLLPGEFQKSLEKEGGIKKDAAMNIARDITRFVFFPVKESLRQLHDVTGVANSTTPQTKKAAGEIEAPTKEAPAPAAPKSKPKREDTYRESFEE